jgi:hypothetical protein
VLCSTLFTAAPVCARESPAYLASIQKRIGASEIVCSATILSTYSASNTVEVGDELASQWTALASVDQVFKGALSSHVIHFDYYRLAPRTADHFGPPTAYFETGVRYAIFLKGPESDLHTAIPSLPDGGKTLAAISFSASPPSLGGVRVSPRTVARSSICTHNNRKVRGSLF